MTDDEPLRDIEAEARKIAEDGDRWLKKPEPVCWDLIELLVVSGQSMNQVADLLGVDPSTVKRRKDRAFWPMETEQQRDWLTAVLKRAMALRWAKFDPKASEAVKAAIAAACEWRRVRSVFSPRMLTALVPVAAPSVIRPRGSTDGPSDLLTTKTNATSPAFGEGGKAPEAWREVTEDWAEVAHAAQVAPEGAWRTWLLMGGRGAGKTRAGAEWVRAAVESGMAKRIALVGPSLHDVREVMIAGPSGLCAIGPEAMRPKCEVTRRRLVWPDVALCGGAVAFAFSAEDPDSLRGPQFDLAWCDEIGASANDVKTWSTLAFGMRLGAAPRIVATTTPRPRELVKLLAAKAEQKRGGVMITRAGTRDNAGNLSPEFVAGLEEDYAGTELGRQELDGELIEDLEGALWSRAMIEAARAGVGEAEALECVVVAVDPPAGAGASARSDACGIIVAGIRAGVVYVLADATVRGLKPAEWAARVMSTADAWGAGVVVAESNQGGEMVRDVLERAGADLKDGSTLLVKLQHARVSKAERAAPVSILYAKGRVRHVRVLKELEDEMCSFGVSGLEGRRARSPDRVDALVWAVDELLRKRPRPRADVY